ncbi:hypothetical protein, partial [Marinobacter flavimaris]
CFRIDRIWLSENRDFFMQNLPACSLRKILLLITAVFRGDYQPTKKSVIFQSTSEDRSPG